MENTLERMKPGEFDSDDEGYWSATDESGPDGFAKGVSFAFYIQPPEQQITHYEASDDGFVFTDDEIAEWPVWFAAQYPDVEIVNDGGEDLTYEIYGEYQDGESTDDLFARVQHEHPSVVKIHNHWCVFYHGLLDYIVHCKTQRHLRGEEN